MANSGNTAGPPATTWRPMSSEEAKRHRRCDCCGHAAYFAQGEGKCMCITGPQVWSGSKDEPSGKQEKNG